MTTKTPLKRTRRNFNQVRSTDHQEDHAMFVPGSRTALSIKLDSGNTQPHKSGEQRLLHVGELLESHVLNHWRKLQIKQKQQSYSINIDGSSVLLYLQYRGDVVLKWLHNKHLIGWLSSIIQALSLDGWVLYKDHSDRMAKHYITNALIGWLDII